MRCKEKVERYEGGRQMHTGGGDKRRRCIKEMEVADNIDEVGKNGWRENKEHMEEIHDSDVGVWTLDLL